LTLVPQDDALFSQLNPNKHENKICISLEVWVGTLIH